MKIGLRPNVDWAVNTIISGNSRVQLKLARLITSLLRRITGNFSRLLEGEEIMKNQLIILAFVLAIILPIAAFLGWCLADYYKSYATFKGAIG